MVYTVSQLKSKKVYNITDGKNLGTVTDISFTFPEGRIDKIFVGEKKFLSSGDSYEMNICCVTKVGDDAIFVTLGASAADTHALTETEE